MKEKGSTINISWDGPFAWPGCEGKNKLASIPMFPGVYLMTTRFKNGYAIYAAGLTRRPVLKRLREHTRKFKTGDYTVLDSTAMEKGERNEVWHGWGWTEEKRREYDLRKDEILEAVRMQLQCFRIFVAQPPDRSRLYERIEATVMAHMYRQPKPLCDLPDKGMMLAPRWDSEEPVLITNCCTSTLYGLPPEMHV